MDKKLLSPAQQVDFLKKDKGITFNLINEQDAERFLEDKIFSSNSKPFAKTTKHIRRSAIKGNIY